MKVLCFIFCLSLAPFYGIAQDNCKFCGTWRWEKNDDRHDFSLEIQLRDGLLIGRHCYILNSGSKMDCATESKDFSFKIENPTSDTLTINVKSYYSGKVGKVLLEAKEGRMYWKLMRAPKGEFYFPKQAVLVVSKK